MPLYNITYVAKKILWFDEFATVEKQKCHLIPQKFKECLTTVFKATQMLSMENIMIATIY